MVMSAPKCLTCWSAAESRPVAMTFFAPICFAICTANLPAAPVAPLTRTVSPCGGTWALDLGWTLCLAPMPVLSKQIEKNLLLWMLSNHLLVEFYTKSWPLRELEISFYYVGIPRCGHFYPILSKVVKVFLNLEVGCAGCKVERCCSRNWPSHVVWGDQHIIRLGPCRKLLRFEEPTKVGNIWLD